MAYSPHLSKQKASTVTHTHTIRACLIAPSQCTMELCWHGLAWGMGRSEVYDCADVNDIIQILNHAACFQRSGSSPLAASLGNLTWIPAMEQRNYCRQEWSGLPRLKMTGQICSGCQFVVWRLCVCPSTHLFIHYFQSEGVHLYCERQQVTIWA